MSMRAYDRAARRGMTIDSSTKLPKGTVKRVWGYARVYRLQIAGFLGIMVLSSLLGAVQPLLVRELIDTAIPERDAALINVIALAGIAVAVFGAAFGVTQRWLSSRVGEGLIFDLRTSLYDHVQRQPLAFFTHSRTGSLMSRMNSDVVGAQRALTGTLGSVTSDVVRLVSTLAVMIALNWQLTLLALALLPVFVLPAKRVGRRLQALTRQSMRLNADMSTQIGERFNVAGALLTTLFGRPEREHAEFTRRAADVRDIGIRTAWYGRVFFVGLGLAAGVASAVVYWLGARLVLSGAITTGTVVAFAAYLGGIYQPLTSLTSARIDVMTALVSFDRVFEVLDLRPAITNAPNAVTLPDAVAQPSRPHDPAGHRRSGDGLSVEFDHVSFSYPSAEVSTIESLRVERPDELGLDPQPDKRSAARSAESEVASEEDTPVLHDVSFTVRPGEMVALVGPSGAGKTTTAMLAARIYDVTGGAVRVGGTDVRDLTLESLRGATGVVAQDPHVFHDSVLANLRYARPEATVEEVQAAATAAGIADLIESLPEGYETVVGERGYRLSGGEKQRLAIARLLLADPRIVILDEATAHLDSESEVRIQQALAAALTGRTSLVIAHRLSTIVNADQILVFDGGRVVEQGTHTELLERGGLYTELYATQFGRDPASINGGAGQQERQRSAATTSAV